MAGASAVAEALPESRFTIQIEGLSFSYETSPVFRDFSFRSSSRVSIYRGPSGCGKTTLLKLMFGLFASQSVKVWNMPDPAFLVLQADTLVPWFTGRENIERFSPPLWEKVRSGSFFDLLRPFIDRRACEMSYGQRRMIELVRAFSAESPLLLLDEPFNFLDPERRTFFLNYLNRRRQDSIRSRIVLTTHYVEEIGIAGADSFEFRGDPPYSVLAASLGRPE